jgi:hypothetical protein
LGFGAEPTTVLCGFTLSNCTGANTLGTTVISATQKKASGEACCVTGGRRGKVVLNCTSTLSLEDTEADAIDRETPTEGTSTSSLWSVRDTGFSFTKRTVKFSALLTGLIVDLEYSGGIPLQSREAVEGTVDTFEDEDDIPIAKFTATKSFQIIGGTLNVSDQDFIDNGYSLNPLVYGLAADDEVITANTDLTHEQGMEYQLGIAYVEKTA